ncbi:MAG: hypothetical protein AAF219_10510 [Myxococcota bacterium]
MNLDPYIEGPNSLLDFPVLNRRTSFASIMSLSAVVVCVLVSFTLIGHFSVLPTVSMACAFGFAVLSARLALHARGFRSFDHWFEKSKNRVVAFSFDVDRKYKEPDARIEREHKRLCEERRAYERAWTLSLALLVPASIPVIGWVFSRCQNFAQVLDVVLLLIYCGLALWFAYPSVRRRDGKAEVRQEFLEAVQEARDLR